jgi:hypothetical protein
MTEFQDELLAEIRAIAIELSRINTTLEKLEAKTAGETSRARLSQSS